MNTESLIKSINFHQECIVALGSTQPGTLGRESRDFHRKQYEKLLCQLDNLRVEEAHVSFETCKVKEVAVANELNEAAEKRNKLELEYAQTVEKSTAALRERFKFQKEIDAYNAAGIEKSREALSSVSSPYR